MLLLWLLSVHSTNVNSLTVTYGPASNPTQFPCAVKAFNVPLQEVQCQLQGGVGRGLQFQIVVGLQTSPLSTDTLSYPAPIISNVTLRFPSGVKTAVLQGTNTQGEYIQFDGLNFGNFPSLITVAYGLPGGPYDQACTQVSGTDTTIQCLTSAGSGSGFVFQVTVLNSVSAPGFDQYSYPQAPVITRVRGCTTDVSTNGTADCPTAGGVILVAISFSISLSFFLHVCVCLFVVSKRLLCVFLRSDCDWSLLSRFERFDKCIGRCQPMHHSSVRWVY